MSRRPLAHPQGAAAARPAPSSSSRLPQAQGMIDVAVASLHAAGQQPPDARASGVGNSLASRIFGVALLGLAIVGAMQAPDGAGQLLLLGSGFFVVGVLAMAERQIRRAELASREGERT